MPHANDSEVKCLACGRGLNCYACGSTKLDRSKVTGTGDHTGDPEGLQPPEGWEGIEKRHWEFKTQDHEVCGGCLMLWPCDAQCLLDAIQRVLTRPWE